MNQFNLKSFIFASLIICSCGAKNSAEIVPKKEVLKPKTTVIRKEKSPLPAFPGSDDQLDKTNTIAEKEIEKVPQNITHEGTLGSPQEYALEMISSLSATCEEVKGSWDSKNLRCSKNIGTPPQKALLSCLDNEGNGQFQEILENDRPKFIKCIETPFIQRGVVVRMNFDKTIFESEQQFEYAKILDEIVWNTTLFPAVPLEGGVFTIEVFIGKKEFKDLLELTEFSKLKYDHQYLIDLFHVKKRVFLSNPKDLKNFLENRPDSEELKTKIPFNSSKELKVLSQFTSDKNNQIEVKSSTTMMGHQCEVYCTITQIAHPADAALDAEFEFEKTDSFLKGIKQFSKVDVQRKKEKELVGFVVLDSQEQPSMYITKKRTKVPGQIMVAVFDSKFNSLGKFKHLSVPSQKEVAELRSSLNSEIDLAKEAVVVTFQSQMGSLIPKLKKALFFGPHSELQFGSPGSLLGWFKNPFGWDNRQFAAGLTSYEDSLGFTVTGDFANATAVHSLVIGSGLEDSMGIRVVPLGEKFEEALGSGVINEIMQLSLNKTLVLNFSMFDLENQTSCNINRSKNLKDLNALIVAAAGDDGKDFTEKSFYGCPQNITSPGKKLIVTHLKNGSMAENANYGVTFADIAADGSMDADVSIASSIFAAPRVSHVAAKILLSFPQLSAENLRFAILMGAKVDLNNPLPVRSGGVLDEAGALAAAAEISKTESFGKLPLTAEQIRFAFSVLYSPEVASKRIDILRTNGEML